MHSPAPKIGVLLVNLGTPDAPDIASVRRYLREFLSDPAVLDMNSVLRWLVLNLVILPRRPRRTAAAYQEIWTDEGSPLLVEGRKLESAVSLALGDGYQVELAMRYGSPSIESALSRLHAAGVSSLIVLPLFPQYTDGITGSILSRTSEVLETSGNRFDITSIHSFHDDPGWIHGFAAAARETLEAAPVDHVLFSFHGLPENQIRKADATGNTCLTQTSCCDVMNDRNRNCYRAQCYATARALAEALRLDPGNWSVSFQSRLLRDPWIRPYTDHVLPELAQRGVKRLAIACPSFVADNLETLEEIGLRANEQWMELGGEELRALPCPNAHPVWVDAVAKIVRAATRPESSASATATPSR